MRYLILAAGAALALSACGKNDAADDMNGTDVNMTADQNMMMDQNMTDQNVLMDQNGPGNTAGGMDGNTATNAATENAMVKDKTTNDPDTNLANGM